MTGAPCGHGDALELERADRAARADPRGRVEPAASRRAPVSSCGRPPPISSSWPGGRPSAASSAAIAPATSGRSASSRNRNATVAVVVSWPANSSVITSSRTCSSLSRPPSSSAASSSSESRSSPRSPLRAAAGDLGEDQPVEAPARVGQRRPRRARTAQHLQPVVAPVVAERALELARGVEPGGAAVRVEAEQRAHRDAQRELPPPRVHVDPVAGRHGRDRALDLGLHRAQRGGDPLAVERGQHDPARAAVELAVDRQQAVAEQRDQVGEAAVAPGEVGRVRDQDAVVGRRPEHEHHARGEHAQAEDRAVALVGVEQQAERVGDDPVRAPHRRHHVAGGVARRRAQLRAQVVRDAHERVGRDRRRAGQ